MLRNIKLCLAVIALLVMGVASAEEVAKSSFELPPAYFPNTEELRADEMRIIALGTGLPTPTTVAQKNSAWLVELGNGDIFLFDIGAGSMTNLFGLRPDFFQN